MIAASTASKLPLRVETVARGAAVGRERGYVNSAAMLRALKSACSRATTRARGRLLFNHNGGANRDGRATRRCRLRAAARRRRRRVRRVRRAHRPPLLLPAVRPDDGPARSTRR